MTDKLTGNAPYYRTVPSSPEPDDDEIFLPGDDEEMSPALPKSGKKAEVKTGKPEEEDEETILRRRLLEKKREKEREELLLKKKQQQQQKVEVREVRTQQQPSSSSAPPKKREPIVWDKEKVESRERRGTTTTTVTTTAGTARSSKTAAESSRTVVEKRGVDQQRGKEVGQKLEKTSTTSSTSNQPKQRGVMEQQTRHGRDEQQQHRSKHSSSSNRAKPGSSTSSSTDRHRHRVVEEAEGKKLGRVVREQENAKKRPREASKSPERRKERRKAPIEGGEGQKKEVPKPEEQHEMAPMEEISPVEEEKPLPTVVMDTVEEVHDDVPSPSAKKPKKYSKFDTPSPEGSDEEGKGAEAGPAGRKHRIGEIYYSEDEQSDFGMDEAEKAEEGEADEEEEGMQVDSDLPENKEFEQLTEQEKAMLTPEKLKQLEQRYQKRLISQLPVYYPGISGCRSVVEYECLNKISEGTFGVVYRAQERRTDEIVALKRLKMEKEHQGFPITSLREINMLLKCGNHPNVLNVREVVVGSSMDKIYMVMEYVEHDMKSLMELMKSRNKKFTIPQVKTLLRQLLSGVEHMHEEYVIHRDLKTSNLLLSHQGILKIGDFGLAREFGEPIKPYTPVVVTLWYRSPELLLSTKVYSTPVDLWSVGCIFGEFLKLDPLFPGRTEVEQLQKIFKEVGTPNEQIWPGCMQLPGMRSGIFADTPYNQLRRKFASELPDDDGYELMNKLLALDPSKRLSATEALKSKWFQNDPKPTPPSSFPTWPAKSEHNKKPPNEPTAPPRKPVGGFTLKFDVPKF